MTTSRAAGVGGPVRPNPAMLKAIEQNLESCKRGWFTWTGINAEENKRAVQQLVETIKNYVGADLETAPIVGAAIRDAINSGSLLDADTIERVRKMTLGVEQALSSTEATSSPIPVKPLSEREVSVSSTPSEGRKTSDISQMPSRTSTTLSHPTKDRPKVTGRRPPSPKGPQPPP